MSFFKKMSVVVLCTCICIPPAKAEVTVEQVKEAVLKELRAEARTGSDTNKFNPAMGLVVDAVLADSQEQLRTDKAGFEFRGAELNFQAAVDPFSRVYAIINGKSDEVEVEEAAIQTTALPGRLTLRFGRYFANFGRFPKFHDHELPFVERLPSLDSFIDGESKADGAELTHLFGTPFFLQGTVGVTNKIGAENERLKESNGDGDEGARKWNAFTYNTRLFTYVPFGDDHGLDIGVSEAYTPRQNFISETADSSHNNRRFLTGVDLTYRWEPRDNSAQRMIVGLEGFSNNERRKRETVFDSDGDGVGDQDVFQRRNAKGGYAYLDAKFTKRVNWVGFYDYAENLTDSDIVTRSYGANVSFSPSEFQRIRLQFAQVDRNEPGFRAENKVALQWTAIIGRHAHGFKDR